MKNEGVSEVFEECIAFCLEDIVKEHAKTYFILQLLTSLRRMKNEGVSEVFEECIAFCLEVIHDNRKIGNMRNLIEEGIDELFPWTDVTEMTEQQIEALKNIRTLREAEIFFEPIIDSAFECVYESAEQKSARDAASKAAKRKQEGPGCVAERNDQLGQGWGH
jgi:hypothetical protein